MGIGWCKLAILLVQMERQVCTIAEKTIHYLSAKVAFHVVYQSTIGRGFRA